MHPIKHAEKARRIETSMAKLPTALYEIRIEAAMLAATHWLNAALHWKGATDDSDDVLHTYMLTVNAFRRLSVYTPEGMRYMAEIEDLRPFYVRGDAEGGEQVSERAIYLCAAVRNIALQSQQLAA